MTTAARKEHALGIVILHPIVASMRLTYIIIFISVSPTSTNTDIYRRNLCLNIWKFIIQQNVKLIKNRCPL